MPFVNFRKKFRFFSFVFHQNFCTALLKAEFFIEPPPDTQRKERQGERGIGVAMSCYLSHANPPLPPPPTPRICHTACGHVIRIS